MENLNLTDLANSITKSWFMGGLNESEYMELISLEYVLTWRYSNNEADDEKRYMVLSARKWEFRANFSLIPTPIVITFNN